MRSLNEARLRLGNSRREIRTPPSPFSYKQVFGIVRYTKATWSPVQSWCPVMKALRCHIYNRGRRFWGTGANLGYGGREYPFGILPHSCLQDGIFIGSVAFGAGSLPTCLKSLPGRVADTHVSGCRDLYRRQSVFNGGNHSPLNGRTVERHTVGTVSQAQRYTSNNSDSSLGREPIFRYSRLLHSRFLSPPCSLGSGRIPIGHRAPDFSQFSH